MRGAQAYTKQKRLKEIKLYKILIQHTMTSHEIRWTRDNLVTNFMQMQLERFNSTYKTNESKKARKQAIHFSVWEAKHW